MLHTVSLCDFCDMPIDGHDCRRALWSDMRYCGTCHHDECYRQGWTRARVIADNERLVKEKNMPEKRYVALPGSKVYHDTSPECSGDTLYWSVCHGAWCLWPSAYDTPPHDRRYCKRCESIAARKEKM